VSQDDSARLHGLAAQYVAGYENMFPDQAEYNGMLLAHHDALPDNSIAALDAWHAREDAWSAELVRIDGAKLWGTPEWALLGYLRITLVPSLLRTQARVASPEATLPGVK